MKSKTPVSARIRFFCYTLLITALFYSCAVDKKECLSNVKKAFPTASVYTRVNGSNTVFVVMDSVNVYLVSTTGITAQITRVELLFKQ